MRAIIVTHMNKVPLEGSIICALAARANTIERILLQLPCSQMLDRARHYEWARNLNTKVECIKSTKYTSSTYLVRF